MDTLILIGQEIPPILPGLLAALLVAIVLHDLLIRRRFLVSKAERDLRQLLGEEEIEASPDFAVDSWAYKFQAAGIKVDADSANTYLYGGSALAGTIVLLTGLALGLPMIFSLVLSGLAAMTPAFWLNNRVKARSQLVEKDLPMALQRLAVNVRINPDVGEALIAVAETLGPTALYRTVQYGAQGRRALPEDSPLGAEFRRTAREARTGGREQALADFERRAQLLSPSLATVAFQLQRYAQKGGGTFGEAFVTTSENLRRILEGRNKAEAKASETMGAIKLIPLMLGLVLIYFMNDPTMRDTFRMPLVQLFLAGVAGWMALGYWFMRNMVEEIG